MSRSVPHRSLAALRAAAGLLLALSACGESPRGPEQGAEGPVSVEPAPAPEEALGDLPRLEIYYDLAAFPWYKRGGPLVHEGRAYRAGARPLARAFDSLRRLGRYQGVEYYADANAGERPDTVFVPVYEGYWQPFSFPAATADTQ